MQADFWHDKWQKRELGFHLAEVNKALLAHWPALAIAPGSTVLLPLCGKTLDLVWLRAQGYRVIGIELSEIALDELASTLQQQLGLKLTKQPLQHGPHSLLRYQADGVQLCCGDFFAVTAGLIGQVDAVYDRAALVALPPAMRADYCQHLRQLSQQAPQLLISFDYPQPQMGGPPFAVTEAEIIRHYGSHYQIKLLDERELIDKEPRFRERGLASFRQQVYWLRSLSDPAA